MKWLLLAYIGILPLESPFYDRASCIYAGEYLRSKVVDTSTLRYDCVPLNHLTESWHYGLFPLHKVTFDE